jgi:hypothetical protein
MPIATQDDALGSRSESHIWTEQESEAIRRYVDDLLQGEAFRGSPRSQRFLRYIIEKTLSGRVESLKERTIGVELFQRESIYDTGQDAVVRVTATEVRKRLLQHYGRYGDAATFHISLPVGSYLPEITIQPTAKEPVELVAQTPSKAEISAPAEEHPKILRQTRRGLPLWLVGVVGVLAGILLTGAFAQWRRVAERHVADPVPISALPPWSGLVRAGHGMQIITSDPNVEQLQELTRSNISVSDYADHIYVPAVSELSPWEREFYQNYEHADNAASVDTPLAVGIAHLLPQDFAVQSRSARSMRIADFQTDDSLVLIGSPRSNPWAGMFADQLDFRFLYVPAETQEIIVNYRPRTGEKAQYVPTARGFMTGETYALVAMVHNQNQSGKVLLLAGINAEGTEAAGRVVTDRAHLMPLLEHCGISAQGPVPDFELLLQVQTIGGSSSKVDMIACHLLLGQKAG